MLKPRQELARKKETGGKDIFIHRGRIAKQQKKISASGSTDADVYIV